MPFMRRILFSKSFIVSFLAFFFASLFAHSANAQTPTVSSAVPVPSPTPASNQNSQKRYPLPIRPWEKGQSVTYQLIELVNNKTVAKEGEVTFSIVDEEEHDGKKYVALEMEKGPLAADGHLINPMRFKIILPRQDQRSFEDFIYDGKVESVLPLATISDIFVGLPASYQPVTSDNKQAFSNLLLAMGSLEKSELQNSVETQKVLLNTQAGSFTTSEYESTNNITGSSSAFWRDPQVPIWGLVKSVDVQGLSSGVVSTFEMNLKSYALQGATTHINKKIIVMSQENRKRMFGEDGGKFSIKLNNLDEIMKRYKK